jgi:hypothetical protein
MLVIKPYVNYTHMGEDEEVWIHNKGEVNNGIYLYRIMKPEGFDHIEIYHKRTDSWMVLTEKALRVLNNGK